MTELKVYIQDPPIQIQATLRNHSKIQRRAPHTSQTMRHGPSRDFLPIHPASSWVPSQPHEAPTFSLHCRFASVRSPFYCYERLGEGRERFRWRQGQSEGRLGGAN